MSGRVDFDDDDVWVDFDVFFTWMMMFFVICELK